MSIKIWDVYNPAIIALLLLVTFGCMSFAIWEISGDYHHKAVGAKESAYEANHIISKELKACAGDDDCIIRTLEEHHEETTAQHDLDAQKDMAKYALIVTVAAIFQALVGALGIIFIAGTLTKTAEAVEATNKQTTVENRPWIRMQTLDPGNFHFLENGNLTGSISIEMTNIGNYPAKSVQVGSKFLGLTNQPFPQHAREWAERFEMRDADDFTIFPNETSPIREDFNFSTDEMEGERFVSVIVAVAVFYKSVIDNEKLFTIKTINIAVKNGRTGLGSGLERSQLDFPAESLVAYDYPNTGSAK